jgi:uncharacterized protein YyaL (SSP411 family)
MDQYLSAAIRLHQYLVANHWNGHGLIGPDPGIRFNYRIGRFIKGYLRNLPWNDTYYYLQAQGYWVISNWVLFNRTGVKTYRDIALRCSAYMLERQRSNGAWDYPNPEWRGRIATVEGIWGSLGLLETYRQTSNPVFLQSALRWYEFLNEKIGFQQIDDELAVNYFANRQGERVPNNSANALRFFAELADVSGDGTYLERSTGLLNFMKRVQKKTGEFPYSVRGTTGGDGRPHFQCYQYNAFACLDLLRYYNVTGSAAAKQLITKVLRFLGSGLAVAGYAFYECGNDYRKVSYHTAVLWAVFEKARKLNIQEYRDLADRATTYLVGLQRPHGGFFHSQGDYYLLSDRRSYPRYLAMILYFLLSKDTVS